jgi:hypothetical protein
MADSDSADNPAEAPQSLTLSPALARCQCAPGECLRNLKPHEYCRRNEGARLGCGAAP